MLATIVSARMVPFMTWFGLRAVIPGLTYLRRQAWLRGVSGLGRPLSGLRATYSTAPSIDALLGAVVAEDKRAHIVGICPITLGRCVVL